MGFLSVIRRWAQMIRAVLFAMATVATRGSLRSRKAIAHGSTRSGLTFIWFNRAVMPVTSRRLRYRSPIFEMPPKRSLPPLERLRGVRPSQAANSRPLRNWCPSPAVATMADAVIGMTIEAVDVAIGLEFDERGGDVVVRYGDRDRPAIRNPRVILLRQHRCRAPRIELCRSVVARADSMDSQLRISRTSANP